MSTKIMHNHHYTTVWKQDYSEQKIKKKKTWKSQTLHSLERTDLEEKKEPQ